jgi:hypothetical protein
MLPGPKYPGDCTAEWWRGPEAAKVEQAKRDTEALAAADKTRQEFYAGRR